MQQLDDELTNNILKNQCFSVQTYKDVNTLCSPHLGKLGLSAFEFARVYDDGTAMILYSDPRIAKYVVEKQLHIAAHVHDEALSRQFWYLAESNGPYSQNLRDIKDLSASNSFANYIQRHPGYFDMYSFLSTLDQSLGSNHFINNKELLEQFAYNFSDRAKELIVVADRNRFKMAPGMATNFGGLIANEENSDNFHLRLYLEKIQQELTIFGPRLFPNLTMREIECIKFLILGNTANEMADIMDLSKRTVEMHLNSIRCKLGCAKKSNIINTIINALEVDTQT